MMLKLLRLHAFLVQQQLMLQEVIKAEVFVNQVLWVSCLQTLLGNCS